MRTEQLEYIAAVTRLGSLRRAAEELRLSQPALSETVRNLERELGAVLLERKRSGATMSAGAANCCRTSSASWRRWTGCGPRRASSTASAAWCG
ncbi:LysR-family transcriptional regulator [Streptomyces hygroscopicus subsp. jinggangensis 5008]|nr:LysR-family transcriptional regulator [Streptomyces hygroscopicus subsp. jinggangensis 5008]AGF60910.1 LysR-family transcriptional regulator [Streptomyces hygroscopicus subsp. jinggangensis TL01]